MAYDVAMRTIEMIKLLTKKNNNTSVYIEMMYLNTYLFHYPHFFIYTENAVGHVCTLNRITFQTMTCKVYYYEISKLFDNT